MTSLGVSMVKLSSKGLGLIGGTINKLQSIGCKKELSKQQMVELLKKNNIFVAIQKEDIIPAGKILFNLSCSNSNSCQLWFDC